MKSFFIILFCSTFSMQLIAVDGISVSAPYEEHLELIIPIEESSASEQSVNKRVIKIGDKILHSPAKEFNIEKILHRVPMPKKLKRKVEYHVSKRYGDAGHTANVFLITAAICTAIGVPFLLSPALNTYGIIMIMFGLLFLGIGLIYLLVSALD